MYTVATIDASQAVTTSEPAHYPEMIGHNDRVIPVIVIDDILTYRPDEMPTEVIDELERVLAGV